MESAKPITTNKSRGNTISAKSNAIENSLNHDIRQFFNHSTGPSILTTNKRIIKVIEPYLNEINENNYKFRERKIINYKAKFEPSDESDGESEKRKKHKIKLSEEDEDISNLDSVEIEENDFISPGGEKKFLSKKKKKGKKLNKKNKKLNKKQKKENHSDEGFVNDNSEGEINSNHSDTNESDVDYIELRGGKSFPKLKSEVVKTIFEAEQELKRLTKEFYINEHKISETKSKYPDKCIPVNADIREFKFKSLADKQMELTGQLFDIIMMDPPWQLSSSQPTRGVAIAYDTLNDNIITDIPVEKLQTDGFIFIWTINAKFKVTLDLIKQWGYKYVIL
jgi:hypothetical protein